VGKTPSQPAGRLAETGLPRCVTGSTRRRVGWLRMLLVFLPVTVIAEFGRRPRRRAVCAGKPRDHSTGRPDRRGDRVAGPPPRPGDRRALERDLRQRRRADHRALRSLPGLDDVVKASLTGSVIGNVLLVLGEHPLAGPEPRQPRSSVQPHGRRQRRDAHGPRRHRPDHPRRLRPARRPKEEAASSP